MSVVITLRGVQFSDPTLPTRPKFVQRGLRAAWCPRADASSLADLSGNGHTLTPVGAPNYLANGVQVDMGNGFSSALIEPASFTLIAAYAPSYEVSPNGAPMALGSLAGAGGAISSGTGIRAGLFAGLPDDPGNRLQSGYSFGAAFGTRGAKIAQPVPGSPFEGPWQWMALTFDDETNEVVLYEPKKGITVTGAYVGSRSENSIHLGYIPNTTSTSTISLAVAQALVYDTPLTPAEVAEQFANSEKYLASIGITLQSDAP